jgi:hypothetical protein
MLLTNSLARVRVVAEGRFTCPTAAPGGNLSLAQAAGEFIHLLEME